MNDTNEVAEPVTRRRWWQKRWLWWLLGILLVLGVAVLITLNYVAKNTEPILRKKIIESMSRRFNAPVELDKITISPLKGLQVTGDGLRVGYTAGDPAGLGNPQQLIKIQHFEFRTDIWSLFHATTSVGVVHVQGMELHIPPGEDRGPLLGRRKPSAADPVSSDPQDPAAVAPPSATAAAPETPTPKSKIPLLVSHVICDDAKLFIETNKPGKEPLEFDIAHLELTDIGVDKPFHYDAQLTNPKPIGTIHAIGSFGPWHNNEPRDTPIDGEYSFSNADLNTIHGIGGMLSSTGHYEGQLGHIVVDGETDTPNFSIDTANRPVPLHTEFHAIVDGTNGDTFLDPVKAHMKNSFFVARGIVKKVGKEGHDIYLDVDMPNARIEDMLDLAVKTRPALMRGALTMKTKLHIPPGSARVAQKLELNGEFHIQRVSFSNPSVQDKVDGLSMRAQGRPQEAGSAGTDKEAEVQSDMKANFQLGGAMMTVHDLNYQIPGALVKLNGVYSLSGEVFEFKGHVRTDATASQMTTGWKSWLLKPVDPFLKKNGAGLELPISISGTKSEPHFGLAFKSADKTTDEMKEDLKGRVPAKSVRKDAASEAKDEKKQEKQDKKRDKQEQKQLKQQKEQDEAHQRAQEHEAKRRLLPQPPQP